MALNSFQLFLNQLQSPSLADKHKIPVLKIVFDILMVHEGNFLGPASPNVSTVTQRSWLSKLTYSSGRKDHRVSHACFRELWHVRDACLDGNRPYKADAVRHDTWREGELLCRFLICQNDTKDVPGSSQSCYCLYSAGNCSKSRTASMLVLLSPRLFLFIRWEPKADAECKISILTYCPWSTKHLTNNRSDLFASFHWTLRTTQETWRRRWRHWWRCIARTSWDNDRRLDGSSEGFVRIFVSWCLKATKR